MQNVTSSSKLKYNLVSRAVYYGATLLRETVPSGDTNYKDIHKVYSIWFCNGRIKFDENPSELDITDRYIHRLGFRRFYDDIDGKVVQAEKASDLMEIVLVELPKMYKHTGEETTKLAYDLFYNTDKVVEQIERIEKVNLTKVRKGFKDMIDYEARTKARVDEAELKMAVTFLRKQFEKGKKFTLEQSVKLLVNNLGVTEDLAKTAYSKATGSLLN